MLHETVETLKQDGHRITKARRGIAEILASASKPMTPSEIFNAAMTRGIGMDKVTVYRELDFLEKQGAIHAVQFQDRHRRYELASLEHHHHLICQKCEGVQDVHVDEDIAAQERAIARKAKFKVLRHSLEFFGLCHSCLQNS